MRISDWSSDVCSSDLLEGARHLLDQALKLLERVVGHLGAVGTELQRQFVQAVARASRRMRRVGEEFGIIECGFHHRHLQPCQRSEEHTSELQSLMRISYAVFCLKKPHNTNKRAYIS